MASKSSAKQDEEATVEEVSGSIVVCKEEEINTFNHDVKLSVLSLRHFVSFSIQYFLLIPGVWLRVLRMYLNGRISYKTNQIS